MNDSGTVNSQIIDATTGVVTLLSGQAPSQAFGFLDAVMVETLGMAMHNAVSRQQGASVIGSAATTSACAKMLSVPFLVFPAPPPAPSPPVVEPVPPPPPNLSPGAAVAAAYAEGGEAITFLKTQAAASPAASLAQTAQTDLNQLITDAGGTPVPPPPSPADAIAAAVAQAEAAINTLKTQASSASSVAQAAQTDLNQLIIDAGGTPPPAKP